MTRPRLALLLLTVFLLAFLVGRGLAHAVVHLPAAPHVSGAGGG